MIIYIYDISTLQVVGKPLAPSLEEFVIRPLEFFPHWDSTSHISSAHEFQDPILDNMNLREKSRIEKILLDGKIELLHDGEYIENGKIVVVEAPEEFLKKKWNKELEIWEEGITKQEAEREMDTLKEEFIHFNEQKEKWELHNFDVYSLENKIAENILKRNYLLTLTF